MQNTIQRLQKLTDKLIQLIEKDLKKNGPENDHKIQNQITERIYKLINIIIQLHKINQEYCFDDIDSNEDKKIIDAFIAKSMKKTMKKPIEKE